MLSSSYRVVPSFVEESNAGYVLGKISGFISKRALQAGHREYFPELLCYMVAENFRREQAIIASLLLVPSLPTVLIPIISGYLNMSNEVENTFLLTHCKFSQEYRNTSFSRISLNLSLDQAEYICRYFNRIYHEVASVEVIDSSLVEILVHNKVLLNPGFLSDLEDTYLNLPQGVLDLWAIQRYKNNLYDIECAYSNYHCLTAEYKLAKSIHALLKHLNDDYLSAPTTTLAQLIENVRTCQNNMSKKHTPSKFERCLFFCCKLTNSFRGTALNLTETLAGICAITTRSMSVFHSHPNTP